MKSWLFILLFCGLLLCGCGRKHKQALNAQNESAAQYIQQITDDGIVRRVAQDIELNAAELAAWIGRPGDAVTYSAEHSALARAESVQTRELGFFGGKVMEQIMNAVQIWFPQLGMIGSFLLAAWTLWRKWKSDDKVMAGYEASNRILKTVKDGEALTVEGVKKILAEAQALRNVGPDVLKDLQTLWQNKQLAKVE